MTTIHPPSAKSPTVHLPSHPYTSRLCLVLHPALTMSNPSSTVAGSSPAAQNQQTQNAVAGSSNGANEHGQQTDGDVTMNDQSGPNGTADPTTDISTVFAARREEEMARKDRSLAEFLVMLDGYKPLVCVSFLFLLQAVLPIFPPTTNG